MQRITEITPVRNKIEPIRQDLIYPGSMSTVFKSGPRVVYLDERFDYPEQVSHDPNVEQERQTSIWNQVEAARGGRFLDRMAEDTVDPKKLSEIRFRVFGELGTRNTAEFYERVFSEVLSTAMDVVVISTGVSSMTGNYFHDIGYLPQ